MAWRMPTLRGVNHTFSTIVSGGPFVQLLKYVNYVQVSGNGGPATPLMAGATGSGASALMKSLLTADQHKGLDLTTDEWRVFAAWIDCNAPYLGSWESICITPTVERFTDVGDTSPPNGPPVGGGRGR